MIDSLNIVINDTDFIAGSNNIKIQDVDKITNGFVNSIICYSLDYLHYESRNALFIGLFNKLSPGGSLTVRFLNTLLLAKKINHSNMSGENFSQVVENIRSVWMEGDLFGILSSLEHNQLNKLYSEDIYSIAVIEKK